MVNEWTRSSGEFDGVIDLDKVLRDPSHPTRVLPAYGSGEHVHPNKRGYAASGNGVPLSLFKKTAMTHLPREWTGIAFCLAVR
jgi:lysophospholipase L1-like esterase